MRTEMPVLKRCCFCLPLRPGLIAWGYFKLALSTLLLLFLLATLYRLLVLYIMFYTMFVIVPLIVGTIVTALVIVDVVLHVLFVIGGHKKSVKLLKVYYLYSMVIWVLTSILGVLCTYLIISNNFYNPTNSVHPSDVSLLLCDLSAFFVNLAVQTYVLILIRSEMVKLTNIGEFSFVNNAAEAQCTFKIYDQYIQKGLDSGYTHINEDQNEKNKLTYGWTDGTCISQG